MNSYDSTSQNKYDKSTELVKTAKSYLKIAKIGEGAYGTVFKI